MRTTVLPTLKQIFQRELHDSRIQCRSNFTKHGRAEIHIDRAGPKTIQDVVRLGSKLETARFLYRECARHGHVELPCGRQTHRGAAGISKRAGSGVHNICDVIPGVERTLARRQIWIAGIARSRASEA